MKPAIVVLALLASCTPATWRHAARVTEIAAVTSLACDGGSTRQYLAESDWIETNPILELTPRPVHSGATSARSPPRRSAPTGFYPRRPPSR